MGWFDEQLRYRAKNDENAFIESLNSISGAVMGSRLSKALTDEDLTSSATEIILKYYHFKPKGEPLPAKYKSPEQQIDYLLSPYGIKSRRVYLAPGWYKDSIGAMLGTLREDGRAVALLPGKLAGYVI